MPRKYFFFRLCKLQSEASIPVQRKAAKMFRLLILTVVTSVVVIPSVFSADPVGGKSLDEMSKEEILASPRWKRAEEAMEDWLSLQLYTPAEIDQLEERCDAYVQEMDVETLRKYLRDAEARLDVLMSPEVQKARDWVGSYMAVLAAPHRKRLQKQLPDLANMSAPEIQAAVREVLQVRQTHGQRGSAEQSRRQNEVTRGRTENARQSDARNAQMQQRQQTQADRADQRTKDARRQSMQNARVQGTTTPEWYRMRRGWFGGMGWRR
ncbi:MAG: hypothetical protein CBB70_05670 [Planctomycetaceae bacterium TMED10]|nr:MAG: hypothetical protein CBB70_05670 [Planctomycetaceae bacterium TMED10]